MLWRCLWVRNGFKKRNVTAMVHVQDTSVCCCILALTPASLCHEKLPRTLEWVVLHNHLKAAIFPVAYSLFLSHFFIPLSFPLILSDSTLWTAGFFCNNVLWQIYPVDGVKDCMEDNFQVSSLPLSDLKVRDDLDKIITQQRFNNRLRN